MISKFGKFINFVTSVDYDLSLEVPLSMLNYADNLLIQITRL